MPPLVASVYKGSFNYLRDEGKIRQEVNGRGHWILALEEFIEAVFIALPGPMCRVHSCNGEKHGNHDNRNKMKGNIGLYFHRGAKHHHLPG